jgi:hypothetical protein
MTGTASPTRLPPTGPRDPAVWLTLLALYDADLAAIDDSDDTLWVVNTKTVAPLPIDLAHLDQLETLGWVDLSGGHNELTVTDSGKYWCRRFIKANGGG